MKTARPRPLELSTPARVAMALSKLSGDLLRVIFNELSNVLDPGFAVAFSSASSELRAATQAPRQQLKSDHEAAAALCHKLRKKSCKALREAKASRLDCHAKGLSSDDLALLGTLGSVLPALETLYIYYPGLELQLYIDYRAPAVHLLSWAGADGVQRLAEKLGAGALPAVTVLGVCCMSVGDEGASALAAPWTEVPCRGSRTSGWTTAPSVTRRWWPSRRPCGGGPRWRRSLSGATGSATRASPPSWRRRRRRRQVRRRRRLEG